MKVKSVFSTCFIS